MNLLPSEHIVYQSNLDSEAIRNRLSENVEPRKSYRKRGIFNSKAHKAFEGSIEGKSFNISPIIDYKNSFLPRISGHIEAAGNGTHIDVKMQLHPFVLVFMFVWVGIVGMAFLGFLIMSLTQGTFDPLILIPLGMLLLGYGITVGGFKYESVKCKKYLADLFEAKISTG